MKTLYTLVLRLLLPFVLARLWWRGRAEPLYREALGERFGHYDSDRPEKLIWIHAVSVGEARAAAPLVRALASAFAEHRILMTCTTAAGRETIKQLYGESVLEAYLPYDLPEAVQRFLEYYRPRLGILMETELWPNLLAQCSGHGVPMLLANARLSARSARGYRRWGALARPAIGALAAVCAQTADDAARLRALGARNVEVTGNLKFDVEPDAAQLAAGRAWRAQLGRPVVLLASTREGEEEPLLAAAAPVRALIVVVPRHARRFDEVARWAQSRRTQAPLPAPGDRVHLGDTMGEMAFYYASCDVAVIGGSFAPLGGQNLIEALAAGAPVIVGPHMYNFAEATRLAVAAGAAVQVRDARQAMERAAELLANDAARARMSQAGRQLCAAHRGATARHLAACKRLLG
ncbi:MAG TPA: 3-deoxy-D-manno-octulosonic acid transferase [Burkholderiales bacterium]|nr:3-deoxy-D-manno-octulosonic acid transferase [Burkholderiales bacterium]